MSSLANHESAHSSRTAERIGFGGVEIELLASKPPVLPKGHLDCLERADAGGATPRVVCSLHMDASLLGERAGSRKISLSAAGDRLKTPGGRLRLVPTGGCRWAASARVAPSSTALGALLEGLSATVLERAGGFVVHAAAVELDGKAFLFIGPSGAGKSTAASQVFGAQSFSVDRVAVSLTGAGAEAWALPGGNRPQKESARAVSRRLPVGGVLRVVQAPLLRVRRLSASEALLSLRESLFATINSPAAEQRRLDAALRLHDKVPVVRLETALRLPLAQTLRELHEAVDGSGHEVG